MSAATAELSETWTLRRRSGAHVALSSECGRSTVTHPRRRSTGLVSTHPGVRADSPDAGLPSRAGASLTAREMEIISLVATGATDQQIADKLFISRRTVTSHMASILYKLDVGNRTAAAVAAARAGLIW
jgi:DNA-binding CsgD family transcriptional regulator